MKNHRSIFVFIGFAFFALFVCAGCGPPKPPRPPAPPAPGTLRFQPQGFAFHFVTLPEDRPLVRRIGL